MAKSGEFEPIRDKSGEKSRKNPGEDSRSVHGCDPLSPALPSAISITTLGDLKARAYRLYGFCACGRQGYLDIDALIARYGSERSFLKGSIVLRCAECGGVADYHLHAPAPRLGYPKAS